MKQSSDALTQTEQLKRYQRLLESTNAIPWEAKLPDWQFTYIGPQIVDSLGYSVDEWLQPDFWINNIHPEDKSWASMFCQDATNKLEDHEFEYRMIAADGRTLWFRDIVNVVVEDNQAIGLHGFMIDVTEKKQSELVLQTLATTGSSIGIDEFYKVCVKNLASVYSCQYAFIGLIEENQEDVRTVAVWAGNDFADNFAYNLNGTPCRDILNQDKELIPNNASRLYPDDELLVQMGVESYYGAPLISAEGKTVGLVSVMDTAPTELTSLTAPILGMFASRIAVETERHKQEQALQTMASFDSLTGLPNRWQLNQRLYDTIANSTEQQNCFCLALLDLDGFKEVNDTLGHFAGDQLLRQLKPRFENTLRDTDYIARLGGDEFAIILNPINKIDEAIAIIEQVRNSIAEPFHIENAEIQVGASVGLCLYPEHGKESSELLRHADVAMYQAKKDMSAYAVYDQDRDPYGPRRLALMNDIRNAIQGDQLLLHYQPKIEASTGKLISVEALVRWQHPVHGFIPPNEFIPFCEVSDLIHELTDFVITRALEDMVIWQKNNIDLKVAVNITARNLMNTQLPEKVQAALDKTSAQPSSLQLEITENDLMHDPDRAKITIKKLNQMGISLSIDDFGTGYSSLTYLKHLEVEELKIDQSFVRDMLVDENDAVIVKSIIDLGHSLGLNITAEGVEDSQTLAQLVEYGCELAQGYHIAKPMSIDALSPWIREYSQEYPQNTSALT